MSNKLFEIKFTDEKDITKVQLLRAGTYDYFGETLEITAEDLSHMLANFKANVLKTDIAIDYYHDSYADAAGWITDVILEDNNSELWVNVAWTDDGKAKILAKKLRYLSVDFETDYKDNETGKRFGITLKGGGLTNRPFVKGMNPILHDKNGAIDKTLKQIDNNKRINLHDPKKGTQNMDFNEIKKGLVAVILSDADKHDLMRLAGIENNDVKFSEEITSLKTRLDLKEKAIVKLSDDIKTHEKEKSFSVLLSDGQAVEGQREAFMSDDMVAYAKGAVAINLSASGSGSGDDAKSDIKTRSDAEDKIVELTDAKMKADTSLTFSEATSLVLDENKDLNKLIEA